MGEIWQGLIGLLASVLNFFFGYVQDYGLAIILLTVTVRILMLPLTIKQTKSMYEMQRLQPKLKALQEKYKKDKEKLQQEIMKFYGENKVNPFGGCLPLLLQLPIFIALFQMLINLPELRGASSLGLVSLTESPSSFPPGMLVEEFVIAAPYYLLIVIMVLTTYVSQKMVSTDPQQQKIMLFMTAFMVFIGWNLPAGVLLYWVTTNIWTMGQQYIMKRFSVATEGKNGKND